MGATVFKLHGCSSPAGEITVIFCSGLRLSRLGIACYEIATSEGRIRPLYEPPALADGGVGRAEQAVDEDPDDEDHDHDRGGAFQVRQRLVVVEQFAQRRVV